MKYIISFNTEFGYVSAESEDPEDLFSAYSKLENVAGQLSNKNQAKRRRKKKKELPLNNQKRVKPDSSIDGVPETTAVLRELESTILNSKFFEEPKTTGDTRERLHDITGKYFASRKVSQALGILKDRGKLRRKGKRNYYQYYLG